MNIRKVNKTFISLIDNELFLWRNTLKQMHPIDMTKILTEENEKDKIKGTLYKYNCVCIQRWKEVSKPFCKSLPALKLLVPYIFEVYQRHFNQPLTLVNCEKCQEKFTVAELEHHSNICDKEY